MNSISSGCDSLYATNNTVRIALRAALAQKASRRGVKRWPLLFLHLLGTSLW